MLHRRPQEKVCNGQKRLEVTKIRNTYKKTNKTTHYYNTKILKTLKLK